MYPCEVAGIQYAPSSFSPSYGPHFNVASTDFPSFDFSNIFAPPPQAQNTTMTRMMVPQVSQAMFINYTCDEAESEKKKKQQHTRAADERRKQRMISNRESARRSRMRKKKQLDEMQTQVAGLHAANCRLLNDLNRVMRDCAQVLHENAELREEAAELRKRLEEIEGAKELGDDDDASTKLKEQQSSLK